MGALVAFRPREAAPPAPNNDNVPAWQGFNAAPVDGTAQLAEDVLALTASRSPARRFAGRVLGILARHFS